MAQRGFGPSTQAPTDLTRGQSTWEFCVLQQLELNWESRFVYGVNRHFDPHQRTISSVCLSQREAFNKYGYLKEQINTFMFMYAHTVCIKLQNLSLCVCVSVIWKGKYKAVCVLPVGLQLGNVLIYNVNTVLSFSNSDKLHWKSKSSIMSKVSALFKGYRELVTVHEAL